MSDEQASRPTIDDAVTAALNYRPPEVEKLAHFLKVFDSLCDFDALSVNLRGYGAANVQRPDPVVVEVIAWLKGLASV